MVDVAGALLTAGLSLASKLIVSWVERGRSRVRVAEVESSIAREAAEEAARLRVRVDDLERATHQMLRELVARTPQISYSRSAIGPAVLDLRFDPRDPASSKQMISDLRYRVSEISADLMHHPQSDEARDVPKVIIEPEQDSKKEEVVAPGKNRSAEMIEELRGKVRDAEGHRK
jgi:uncharacterized caspase-like protein